MATRHPDPEKVKPSGPAPHKTEAPVAPTKPAGLTGEPVKAPAGKGPDPHGAPAKAERAGSGDEQVVAECLAALGKITDAASLETIHRAVVARVPAV